MDVIFETDEEELERENKLDSTNVEKINIIKNNQKYDNWDIVKENQPLSIQPKVNSGPIESTSKTTVA